MTQSNNMSVEHSAVSAHVSSLENNHAALQAQSNQFLSAIEPLKASWKGSSVAAWDNMTEAWHENMTQINNALQELTGRVDQAGKDYQTGEEEQAEMIRNRFAGMSFTGNPLL